MTRLRRATCDCCLGVTPDPEASRKQGAGRGDPTAQGSPPQALGWSAVAPTGSQLAPITHDIGIVSVPVGWLHPLRFAGCRAWKVLCTCNGQRDPCRERSPSRAVCPSMAGIPTSIKDASLILRWLLRRCPLPACPPYLQLLKNPLLQGAGPKAANCCSSPS